MTQCLPDMKDVIVTKRRRSWEWRVTDESGRPIMSGRERSRPAARYQGYRTLFMLLAIGQRPDTMQALRSGRNIGQTAARGRPHPVARTAPSASAGPGSEGFTPD
ncbi:hypothetical protein [Bradyrhizobium australiense]|uniref:Uncharacterized protein n=1 Tax=Bradyrhizobium australiense TaxID=2721161 RepID=A0A7Y4LZ82_9BRAD|nr:hypothetical protein [Bradyrhizobium australiense]NOJ44041.1 hypothetical protein [Bradyrhizobium australiense]